MCNACGFHCCGDDSFEGCGCDHCHEPACWADDDAFDDDYDDDGDDFDGDGLYGALGRPSGLRCIAIAEGL